MNEVFDQGEQAQANDISLKCRYRRAASNMSTLATARMNRLSIGPSANLSSIKAGMKGLGPALESRLCSLHFRPSATT